MEDGKTDRKADFFSEDISKKERLKLKEQQNNNSVWSGLGLMGMVGWSVAVPTLAGAAMGIWLDKSYPEFFSWTLSLLFAGIVLGGIIAWYWVLKEDKEIHDNKEN